ncbi:MAG: type-F conjugative transfer system secretin TraK [Thiothrix sp.]|uniref:TraK domain-containing protein n=1 Tax=Thiothrix sp. TaxID=1032 RepID=UPI0026351F88|nr:type-F conjugative transfer system secretin TraK [Thiothrix sp.]MDD5394855.1 type-F conjugative transfer system secretin TraK [Thiothrix sp.]
MAQRTFNRAWGIGLLLLLGQTPSAWAVQDLTVQDGDNVAADISTKELTRFSMASGRITRIWGPDDRFAVEPDKEGGQLFVRLLDGKKEPFSVFVKDGTGATYTVLATPKDMPSDSVVLHAQAKPDAQTEADSHGYGGGAYSAVNGRPYNWVNTLKGMMRGMALGTLPGAEPVNETINIDMPGTLVLLERYNGDLTGEVYEFTARGATTLDERQFEATSVTNGADVKAVAVDEMALADGQTTRIYVVKANGEDL